MASTNQNFVTYAGDAVSPIITVTNARTGAVIDISSVLDITWSVRRDLDSPILLTKKKSLGQITFVNTGTDGQFQVAILSTDTSALSGNYLHLASITDAGGNVTTVTVGVLDVGPAPTWSYDPGQVGLSNLHTIRSIIGDVKAGDQLLFDAEIKWANSVYSNVWLAASECCRNISARFSRDVDTVQGELRTLYASRQKAYKARAVELEQLGYARGGSVGGYAGGISQTDKDSYVLNPDRVAPQFNIGMMDNLLPIGPVGHETPGSPQSETGGIDSDSGFGP